MKQNPLRRISVRLTLWYSGMLVALVALLAYLLYAQLDQSLHRDLDQQLRETAQASLTLVELEHGKLIWEGTEPGRVIPDALPNVEQRRNLVRLIDRDGNVQSAPAVLDQLPVGSAVREAEAGGRELLTTARVGREAVRVHTVAIHRDGRFLGALQVVTSLEPLFRTLRLVAHVLVGCGLFTLLVSLAIGQFLAYRALAPVTKITRAASTFTVTDLSRRLNLPQTGDELGALAASFDGMLERIEAAYRRQREFTADASHELRTPLSLIKGEASFARRSHADPQEVQLALEVIEDEADRMTCLVEDLLLLARLDGGDRVRFDPVGLDELAHEVEARLSRPAQERGLRLSVEAADAVIAHGDEGALRRVFLNLTQNAVEHTSAGEIRIRVTQQGNAALVEVSDTGCGIPAAECERVFDRFYRADPARHRGGAGLGLALCQEIIKAHGGTIHLTSTPLQGTTVTFRLPTTAPRLPDA